MLTDDYANTNTSAMAVNRTPSVQDMTVGLASLENSLPASKKIQGATMVLRYDEKN